MQTYLKVLSLVLRFLGFFFLGLNGIIFVSLAIRWLLEHIPSPINLIVVSSLLGLTALFLSYLINKNYLNPSQTKNQLPKETKVTLKEAQFNLNKSAGLLKSNVSLSSKLTGGIMMLAGSIFFLGTITFVVFTLLNLPTIISQFPDSGIGFIVILVLGLLPSFLGFGYLKNGYLIFTEKSKL